MAKYGKKTIGYLRVSTVDQDLDKNKHEILELANNKDFGKVDWVEEKVSGKKSWKRRKIKDVIDSLDTGDRIIVPELSRLGRSMLEIMEMLSILNEKEVCVYSVKGGWELNGSIQSKVMAMAFSIAAEIERDLISKRTREALRALRKIRFSRLVFRLASLCSSSSMLAWENPQLLTSPGLKAISSPIVWADDFQGKRYDVLKGFRLNQKIIIV